MNRMAAVGAGAVFDKSNEIDALIEFCIDLGSPSGAPVNQ